MIRAGLVGKNVVVTNYNTRWDEKGRTMISHIFISFNEFITSVQFGYSKNGSLVLSERFGGSFGSFRTVRLNEDEYVTGLSGVVQKEGIINLTFNTNRGKHGPFGRTSVDSDARFCSKIDIDPGISDRSEFSGFFGTCSNAYLSSIGIYVSPTPRTGIVVRSEDDKPSNAIINSGLLNRIFNS